MGVGQAEEEEPATWTDRPCRLRREWLLVCDIVHAAIEGELVAELIGCVHVEDVALIEEASIAVERLIAIQPKHVFDLIDRLTADILGLEADSQRTACPGEVQIARKLRQEQFLDLWIDIFWVEWVEEAVQLLLIGANQRCAERVLANIERVVGGEIDTACRTGSDSASAGDASASTGRDSEARSPGTAGSTT